MDVIFWSGGINESRVLQRYIGPYKIAHWIRKHGFTAQVIDFVDQANETVLYNITKRFISNDTKILGLSTTFFSCNTYTWKDGKKSIMPEHVLIVLQRIKDEFPHIKIIAGGYLSDKIPNYGLLDASIMSYTKATEDIFLEYLQHLTTGSPLPQGRQIFPILSNGQPRMHFEVANNPKYNIETDDFKFTKQDCILPGEPLPLDLSRGCIFACRFCQYPHLGKKKLDYIRSMELIEEEMLHNYQSFGTASYYVLDDTFNDTEIKMQQFYNMTQRLPFKLNYAAYIRADLVHRFPNTSTLLKESGLIAAFHGIETFHPKASKLIGKGWSGTHGKDFLPKLHHEIWGGEVSQHLSFIVGITGDTVDNVNDTANWFISNHMPSSLFHPLGLYGNKGVTRKTIQSEFDMNAEKYGYTILPGGVMGRVNWSNDNWTNFTAKAKAEEINKYLEPYQKYSGWSVLPLLWYGYDRIEINNTCKKGMSRKKIKNKNKDLLIDYFMTVLTIAN